MKYGILSDVHANPAALESALADGAACGVEKWICCGDVTGYGYDAKRALELVRARMDVTLKGNHDAVCAKTADEETKYDRMVPNYDLDRSVRAELGEDGCKWLRELPFRYGTESFACAHGSFVKPENFDYIETVDNAKVSFRATREPLLFVGHTHVAEVYAENPEGDVEQLPLEDFTLREGWRYLVNVGSIGYPRHTYDLTYVVYDTEAKRITVRHLHFDVKSYAENLKQAGIPLPHWVSFVMDLMDKFE